MNNVIPFAKPKVEKTVDKMHLHLHRLNRDDFDQKMNDIMRATIELQESYEAGAIQIDFTLAACIRFSISSGVRYSLERISLYGFRVTFPFTMFGEVFFRGRNLLILFMWVVYTSLLMHTNRKVECIFSR
jgi:hypothetical protein